MTSHIPRDNDGRKPGCRGGASAPSSLVSWVLLGELLLGALGLDLTDWAAALASSTVVTSERPGASLDPPPWWLVPAGPALLMLCPAEVALGRAVRGAQGARARWGHLSTLLAVFVPPKPGGVVPFLSVGNRGPEQRSDLLGDQACVWPCIHVAVRPSDPRLSCCFSLPPARFRSPPPPLPLFCRVGVSCCLPRVPRSCCSARGCSAPAHLPPC